MADRKDFFFANGRPVSAARRDRPHAEIKQRMLDMAAAYQAKADEDQDAEQ
jgi:hypothetical protein